MASVRLAETGIKQLDQACRSQGWKRQSPELVEVSGVSLGVLKRFWRGLPIRLEAFAAICKAIGVDPTQVSDYAAIAPPQSQSSHHTVSQASEPHRSQARKQARTEVLSSLEAKSGLVGREGAIADLDQLVQQGKRCILLHQRGGEGKTSLAKEYLKCRFSDRGEPVLEFLIAKEAKDISSVEGVLEERLRQLGQEPGREFGVSLDRFKRALTHQRVGILFDNLESALDAEGRLIETHRRYIELLRVVSDPEVQSVTLITSRDRLCEPAVDVETYSLPTLDVEAWREFFKQQGIAAKNNSTILEEMHKAYSGNAKAMTLLCGAVKQDYECDLTAYWQDVSGDLLVNAELRHLISEQFDRLKHQNANAYNLLVRMGCYRYQDDVPAVPKAGLICLLWDVSETQHQRVIQLLRDRALVEFKHGEYWLHPEIKAEAIERLRGSQYWETTNRRVADFWTESVQTVETSRDALRALEAYYHYLELEDHEKAADVLLRKRDNEWEIQQDSGEPLEASLCRFGFLKLLEESIERVMKFLNPKYFMLSHLNYVLGDAYLLFGKIHLALESYTNSKSLAGKSLLVHCEEGEKFGLERLITNSSFGIGLCYLALAEDKKAKETFENLYYKRIQSNLLDSGYYEEEEADIMSFLASVYSLSGLSTVHGEKALELAKKARRKIAPKKLNAWSIGNSYIQLGEVYSNLSEFEQAYQMYYEAIRHARRSNYIQIEGKALTGLAKIHQKREQLEEALCIHVKSIDLLKHLGAKVDLAEAWFQMGLTYQVMHKVAESQESFDKAIQLFEVIAAPKQVERVKQSISSNQIFTSRSPSE